LLYSQVEPEQFRRHFAGRAIVGYQIAQSTLATIVGPDSDNTGRTTGFSPRRPWE
jgi:hypothetical protein